MARMSIDDKFLRDPRVRVLAKLCGWSVRETRGALLDVWAVTYDQVTPLLSGAVIDMAAEHEGFTEKLIEAELGARDRSGKVRIVGAKKRIEYLDHKKRAGRQGGLKSAEQRTKEVKQTSSSGGSTPQSAGNPIPTASVPDSASASAAPPERETHARAAPALAPLSWSAMPFELWSAGAKSYGALVTEGIDPKCMPNAWNGLPDKLAGECVRWMRDDRGFSVEQGREFYTGAIASAEAKARSTSSLKYFTPPRFLAIESFRISGTTSPEQARAPQRDVRVGRFEPVTDYPDGEQEF
jgi:hypothetical protein